MDDLYRLLANICSYLISAGLVLGDLLHWLNSNYGACGVLLGVLTFCTNVYFQVRNSRLIARSHVERRKGCGL